MDGQMPGLDAWVATLTNAGLGKKRKKMDPEGSLSRGRIYEFLTYSVKNPFQSAAWEEPVPFEAPAWTTEAVADVTEASAGMIVWMPHSVLADPTQRPARSSSDALTADVHGLHPILGYP